MEERFSAQDSVAIQQTEIMSKEEYRDSSRYGILQAFIVDDTISGKRKFECTGPGKRVVSRLHESQKEEENSRNFFC